MNTASAPTPAMVRKVVIASVLGNAFEWFDFAIFGMFAVVISKIFFPADGPAKALLLTLATFGVSFAIRPIGAIILGLYGDRFGRKKALTLTVTLMAIGTGAVGILPTYDAIGIAAPLLLVLARLVQGFSAGGEFSSATTMLIEFSPTNLRGFYGSFQMCSQSLAFSLGALVAYVVTSSLTPHDLSAWGWRLPFLFGILIGVVGWVIRQRIDESPEFLGYLKNIQAKRQKPENTPFKTLLRDHSRALIAAVCLTTVGTVSAYVFIFFLPIFAKKMLGLSMADVNLSTCISTAVILVICPLAGYLSDRFGRRTILVPAIIAYAVVALVLFRAFIHAPSFETLLEAQVGIAFCMSFMWGPAPIVLTEIFPVGVRSIGAAITYNLAVMVFGGFAPFVNTWLVHATGSNMAPIYYVEASVVIGLVGMLLLPERVPTVSTALVPE